MQLELFHYQGRRFDAEMIARIKELGVAGWKPQAAALQLGIGYHAVYKYYRILGIKTRKYRKRKASGTGVAPPTE